MTDTVTQCSGTIGKECLGALDYTIHSSQERNLEGLGEESLARRGPFLMMCKAGLGKAGRKGERCSRAQRNVFRNRGRSIMGSGNHR